MARLGSMAAVVGLVLFMTVSARATDVRGMVTAPVSNGFVYSQAGRPGIYVVLAVATPYGPRPLAQSMTDPNGFYFFFGVPPGQYVLVVGPAQYPVAIGMGPAQDIPPILLR
jgi:hypothetical protein